jgi:hypothetical protein
MSVDAKRGENIKLLIMGVTLPTFGGETSFDIVTFYRGMKMDENLNCCTAGEPGSGDNSFRIPRALGMVAKTNRHFFKRYPDLYPVEAALPTRFGDDTYVSITFTGLGTLEAGGLLEVFAAEGYSFVEPLPGFAYDVALEDVTTCGSKEGVNGCYFPPLYVSLAGDNYYGRNLVPAIHGNMMAKPRLVLELDDKQMIWNKKYNPS